MSNLVIENGLEIDDVEAVLYKVGELSGKRISDIGVIKKFIQQEKNTKYYVDDKLNSSITPDLSCTYVWLDTGFTDAKGNPILISLVKEWDKFIGHIVGTINYLAQSAMNYFRLKKSMVNDKIESFKRKYHSKVVERAVKHITDEREYLIGADLNVYDNTISKLLAGLELDFSDSAEEEVIEFPSEEIVMEDELSQEQVELTIEILLEKLEEKQAFIDELMQALDKSTSNIEELQQKNAQYHEELITLRSIRFQGDSEEPVKEATGHNMLGKHNKILVVGGEHVGADTMRSIAVNEFLFNKDDFDFIEHKEAKKYMQRVRENGRYRAIIFGNIPHSTAGNNGYSSAVEKWKRSSGIDMVVGAGETTGKMRMSKTTFRDALSQICNSWRVAFVA